jgi:hypothetical protein
LINVTAIVEGYGDVSAVPQLLSMIGGLVGIPIICKQPIRAGEWKRLRGDGILEKYLSLAASRQCDQILLILDLEDDCCATEYVCAMQRIVAWDNGRGFATGVVFLVREYETLFLMCADDFDASLAGGIPHAESFRDAKGQMRQILGRRYKETQDQLALTRRLTLPKLINRSRPFRKLVRELTGSSYVTIQAMSQ